MTLPRALQQVDKTHVVFRGRKLSYFGGCDYFRLSTHPNVRRALRDGLKKFGLNVSASRMTTGNHALYEKLERRLADFFGAESALLVSSGYVTNLAVAQALAGDFSHVLLDERAHVSLVDAAGFLDCPVVRFKHRVPSDVARVIARLGKATKTILLTDGVFAHDGSLAPLKVYLKTLARDGWMLVDDSHGAGVLGEQGRGTIECEGVGRQRIIQTITLSKAFGVYGGAVLCSRQVRDRIIERSRLFVGNTPLPLPLVAAAIEAVATLQLNPGLRRKLRRNSDYVKSALRRAGLALPDAPGPIIACAPSNPAGVARLRKRLLARGIFPSLIRYPGGPDGGYFRFAISSEHTEQQLDALAAALVEARRGPNGCTGT